MKGRHVMRLSALLITWHLKKKYCVNASDWLSAEPHLKYPLTYDGTGKLEDGILYMSDDPDFAIPSHKLSKTFLILTGAAFRISPADYPNLCILPQSVSLRELAAYLQEIFSLYEDWNQDLFDSRLNGASIQQLLDLTDRIIPNPMLLVGMDFTVIASKKTSYEQMEIPILGSDEETRDLVNALKNDQNYEEALYRTGYFYYPGNPIAVPALCVNIFQQDRVAFRLMINEGEIPLDDTFGFLLEYLARMISHALLVNPMADHGASAFSLHQVFSNLLTDPSADYVEISQQFSAAGWLSSHTYQCILLKTGILDFKNLTLRSICGYVENTIPASCALEHQGNVVIYVNLDLCSLPFDEVSQRLAGFIRDSLLNAGYSRKMLGHFNFQRQYQQALLALQVGRRVNPSLWIHHFNQDIALRYIMEQSTKKLPAYMICHEKLIALKNADAGSHTQLYRTLRCYLENHQSVTRTAQALFIHRSTLLYRLEKIQDFMKSDFSNPNELLYLLLSFHLLEMEGD
ncbi:MAG: helix-turn-helix domain-containing protein [Lachnospiraceae bacterium]|nr:helix-turn-helix domain-containing protein [Lachnospiraceae bacterium]